MTFEAFEVALREALSNLYDPTFEPADSLWLVTGCDPTDGVRGVQNVLIQAVQDLEPAPEVPSGARIRRLHQLLSLRYVQQFTQERAADYLGITPRHLRREQNEAVELLARRLWQRRPAMASAEGVDRESAWRAQLAEELDALQESAPGGVADAAETLRGVATLLPSLLSQRGIALEVEPVPLGMAIAIHPAALRQIVIAAGRQLAELMSAGTMALGAQLHEERARISLSGTTAATALPGESQFIADVLAMHHGTLTTRHEDGVMTLTIDLPSAQPLTVLVIDDNEDLVHFYRRYTAGTRYRIVHEREGQRVFETLTAVQPDIIVLDIMLPDVDGWELLSHLYESPAARAVPIIVCSVVREEALALALGATLYLPKPVRRAEFVKALDRALDPYGATST